ncbi:MAG: sulfur carrier protein ThiS [Fastidiosipilaceae bacterium]|nr:sulfur carrier protein ThiS [Clostridiaceae bacterium]
MPFINGKKESKYSGVSVHEYLAVQQFDERRIAVEYNGKILPEKDYDKVILKDGDQLEVVTFVGGG